MQRIQIRSVLLATLLLLCACNEGANFGADASGVEGDAGPSPDATVDTGELDSGTDTLRDVAREDATSDVIVTPDTPTPDTLVPDTEPRPPREGGGECDDDEDCGAFLYCEEDFGEGFCAPAADGDGFSCVDDSDCIFANSDELFCCSTVSFGGRICIPASEESEGEATCGDNLGRQGDDCSVHGHGDCRNDTHLCAFEDSDYSFCAEICGPTFGDCGAGSYCFYLNGPWGFCMPDGGELDPGENCVDDPFMCREQSLCVNGGNSDDPYGWCAEVCNEELGCPVEETCNAFGICEPQGELRAGDACLDDRFACGVGLICAFAGTRAAECSRVCEEDYECPTDSYCFDLPRREEGICRERGSLTSGDFCGDDPGACPGICTGGYLSFDPGGYCLEQCDDSSGCGEDSRCDDVLDLGTYCVPNGTAEQGESCVLDPFECAADHFCVDYGSATAFCGAECETNEDCDNGTWCTAGVGSDSDSGVCYPGGDLEAGTECDIGGYECEIGSYCAIESDPRCYTPCTQPPHECPAGHECLEPNRNDERWCYPSGDAGYGESCADDRYACANPGFCADAGSSDARCTTSCLIDDECPGDDWCLRTVYGGFCRPGGGELGQGESCEDQLYSCEEDLLCILGGEQGSFCALDCTGFAERCAEGEACRFLGFSMNFCVETGTISHGGSCAVDRFACDEESWCVNAGTENAVCVRTCSEDATVCPDGTRCQYLSGGFGVCIGAGLSPSDPLNPGGNPL